MSEENDKKIVEAFLKKVDELIVEGCELYKRDVLQLGSLFLEDGKYFISSDIAIDDDGFSHFIVSDDEQNEMNIRFKISEV